VPASDSGLVTESGVAAEQAAGVEFLRMESGAAVYRVRAGNYEFASKRF